MSEADRLTNAKKLGEKEGRQKERRRIQEEIDQVKKEMTLDLDDENSENWNATVRKFAENLKQSFDEDTSSKSDDGGDTNRS